MSSLSAAAPRIDNVNAGSEAFSLLSAPVSPLHLAEVERLNLLASLFSEQPGLADFDQAHYALPILVSYVRADSAAFLLEAWCRSGLYHLYNLLLLAEPDVMQHAPVQDVLQACPGALAHLCLRSPQAIQSAVLMAAIQTYLPCQEPHSYLRLEPHDPWMHSAMSLGLLALSTHSTAALSLTAPDAQRRGFLVEHQSPQALARELHTLLFSDWEELRHVAAKGQQWAHQRQLSH